jgi:hypothetical protein
MTRLDTDSDLGDDFNSPAGTLSKQGSSASDKNQNTLGPAKSHDGHL